jgi:glycosyltransferase involved in cell wall biosynthesis
VRLAFAVPGPIDGATGGYVYDRHIVDGLRARGWTVDLHVLPSTFPSPSAADLAATAQTLGAIPEGTAVIIDGLAFGAMAVEVERHARRLRLIALVHLPLAQAVGLEEQTVRMFERTERRALAAASLVLVTGSSTVAAMARYGIPLERVELVEPGVDRAPIAHGSADGPPHLLCVATVNRGKGHEILIDALAGLRDRPWRLTCVGSLTRDAVAATRARNRVSRARLEGRVCFTGELCGSDLEACYEAADLFVLPTLFETYGIAVAEALAHGLAVISTDTGAIAKLVGKEAGLIVSPGDVAALRGAVGLALSDDALRRRLRAGAARARLRLSDWSGPIDRVASLVERICAGG